MALWVSVGFSAVGFFSVHYQSPVNVPKVLTTMDKKIDKESIETGNIFGGLIRRQVGGTVGNQVDEETTHSYEYVRDHGSLLSLQPWIFRKETGQDDEDKMKVNGDYCQGPDRLTDALQAELSPRNVSLGYGRGRGRSSLRSRRHCRYSVKPVPSVGNCLIPQLYNEHFALEENVSSSVPVVRPLTITDGSKIISKSTYDILGMPYRSGLLMEGDGMTSGQMKTVVGVSPLPQFRSPKQKSRDVQHRNLETLSSPRTWDASHSQDSPSRMLLFYLGINIGVMSTFISNRREIERLNNMLKHTENLVQDLQEELDMKDALSVKELNDEAFESERLDNSYVDIEDSTELPVPQARVSASCPTHEANDHDQPCLSDIGEFSRIEAELEAELERLELNMNASTLEGKMSALGQLDPDLIADVVHGELRADMLNGGASGGKGDANSDSSSSTAETHNVNYAVSPRELSLRLHEVIQFRLEERIEELERALRHSQKQVEFMKAERALSQSQRAFAVSEIRSYSDPESPTLSRQNSASAQPLCLNLTGDALHAYGEAYEEFMRITGTQQRARLLSTANTCKDVYGDGFLQSDGRIPAKECIDKDSLLVDSRPFRSVSMDSSDVESNESDDEEAKMLIQQIVENTRKGSTAVAMNASECF